MIKLLTNYPTSSSTPKITITSQGLFYDGDNYVLCGSTPLSGAPNYYELSTIQYSFIKLSYANLSSTNDIAKTIIHFVARSIPSTSTLKVYFVPSITSFPNNGNALYQALDLSVSNLVEQVVLESSDSESWIEVDLSKVTSLINSSNSDFIIALVCDANVYSSIMLYDPAQLSNFGQNIYSFISTSEGLNFINKFFECSCSSSDKGYINLCSGKNVHLFDCLKTSNKKLPITLSLAYSADNLIGGLCFNNAFRFNFEYTIGKSNNIYYLTDYTGKKRAYFHITRPNDSLDYDDLGIKHLDNEGELYYCYEDCSYMYVDNDSTFEIYDRADNYMLFTKFLVFTKLNKIRNALGEEINFFWTTYGFSTIRVTSITSSYGDSISLSYDQSNSYRISSINYVNECRSIVFSYSSGVYSIDYYNTENGSSLYKQIDISFSNNKISIVEEKNASNELMKKLTYDYSSDKVSTVSNYDYSDNLIAQTVFNYYEGYTKTTDYEGNSLYYYFDKFGRTRTILDDKGRTQSFNYDEIVDGVAKGATGQSKVQCNSRNLLENHSFEYLDNDDELIFWNKTGSGSFELSDDGLYGGKCLHISGSNSITLSQEIEGVTTGEYKLKIRAKASTLSSCIVRVTLDYVTISVVSIFPFVQEEIPHSIDYDISSINVSSWEEYSTNTISILTNVMKKVKITVEIISNGGNDIYFDDFQLSNTNQITRYNLIENAYLESKDSNNLPVGWTCTGLASNDKLVSVSSSDEHSSILGSTVMRLSAISVPRVSTYFARRILEKTVDVSGRKNDEFSFSVWAKCYATENVKLQAFITFEYENIGQKTYYFDFEKNLSSWQLLSRSVLTEDDYDYISVGIIYDGGEIAYFDAFQLCKDSYGTYYNYDRWGNLVETISSSGGSTRIVNEEGKLKSIVLQDGSHYVYHYNENGRLTGASDLNGTSIAYEYTNGNITETEITNGLDTITNTFAYDTNDNLISKTDEFNTQTSFTYDNLRRVSSSISQIGTNDYFKETYSYDSLSNLTSLSGFNNISGTTPDYKNEMSYHSRLDLINTITSLNGTEYTFSYDSAGRLLSVSSNNNVIQSLTYNELVNGVNRNLISTKKYGDNGDIFSFIYDEQDRLTEAKLNNVTVYEYEYNEFSELSLVKDISNNINKYYSYDLKGKLIKVKTDDLTFKYEYDNLGNIQKKSFIDNSKEYIQTFDYDYEFNDYSKQGFLSRLGNNYADEVIVSDYHGIGEYGLRPKYISCGFSYDSTLKSNLFSFTDTSKFIWYNLSKANSYRTSGVISGKPFDLEEWKSTFNSSKTIYLWFKPTRTDAGSINIFQLKSSSSLYTLLPIGPTLSVDIDENDKIKLAYQFNSTIITTSNSVNYNQWNFLALKLQRNIFTSKATIKLNGTSTSETDIGHVFMLPNILAVSMQTLTPIIPTPTSSEIESGDYSMPITFYVSLIGVSNKLYTNNELTEINNAWQKYFLNQETNTVKAKATSYYNQNLLSDLDHISLNGEVVSKNGIEPISYPNGRVAFDKDKETAFKYDPTIMRKVYSRFADSFSPLKYSLPLTTNGTFSIFFKVPSANSYPALRTIFAFYDSSGNIVFSAHLDNHNNCIVNCNGTLTTIYNRVPLNSWNNIYLCMRKTIRVVLFNGDETPISSINLSGCTLYLGSDNNKSFPLKGYLEQMYFSNIGVLFNSSFLSSARPITVGSELDYLSRPITKNIVYDNSVFSSSYSYNKTRIASETTFDNVNITYTYDYLGNVTSVSSVSGNETYTYDKLSRLASHIHFVSENNSDNYTESFTYDSNGNITSLTRGSASLTFQYNGDRLISVKDNGVTIKTITYDSNNIFYPSIMTILGTNQSLSWSGKRLTNIGSDIEYRYNDNGIRIYKSTPLEETTYELEGSNIVALNKTVNNVTYRFDFHYDINGLLVGLTYNNKEYFYIRDILGNILGIINSNGNFIVKYEYTAYGEITKTIIASSGNDLIVATHNPFVYKGYYYDDETHFYYLKSRYYDPSICRFISIDDFAYLDPNKLTKINLYAYCGCNPIMYYDPSGHGFIIAIIVGALVGALVGAIDAYQNGGDIIKGAIIGFLVGAFVGAGTALAATFLTPLIGTAVTIGGATLNSVLAVGIGFSIAYVTGFIGGALSSIFSQLNNTGKVKWKDVLDNALQGGKLSVYGTLLGLFTPVSNKVGEVICSFVEELFTNLLECWEDWLDNSTKDKKENNKHTLKCYLWSY